MPSECGQSAPRCGSMTRRRGEASRTGDRPVRDDEQALSGTYEAEFAAGEFLDRGRVISQAGRLFGQATVVLVKPRDGVSHVLALSPHLDGLNESAITGHAVGHDDHEREDDGRKHDAACGRRRRIGCWYFSRLVAPRAQRERALCWSGCC